MSLYDQLRCALVVSVQPVENGPLDSTDMIVAMAMAAESAGANALRIEGAGNVAAVKAKVSIPVIGIVKRERTDSPIVITADLSDIDALVAAGADVIAVDATNRNRPEPVNVLINRILEAGVLAMADCSTVDDVSQAISMGAHIVGTTLSGYTRDTEHLGPLPDFALLRQCRTMVQGTNVLVMAEGRFNSPELAAQALVNGADCVTVGSAITRIEHIVGWFTDAMSRSANESN